MSQRCTSLARFDPFGCSGDERTAAMCTVGSSLARFDPFG
jgi:hypothetical protein